MHTSTFLQNKNDKSNQIMLIVPLTDGKRKLKQNEKKLTAEISSTEKKETNKPFLRNM